MKDAAGVIHDDFVNPSEDLKILNDKQVEFTHWYYAGIEINSYFI